MWENVDASSSLYNSFDLNFISNETNTEDDTNNFIFSSDGHINLSKKISRTDNMQVLFNRGDNQLAFNDDPIYFRREISTQSFLSNDEFDLIGHPIKELNKLNNLYLNKNLYQNNNNNNNNSSNLVSMPVKITKRGRGRGSRGSYRPRGGTRNRMLNQVNQQLTPSFNNSTTNNMYSYNNGTNLNHSGSTTFSNTHQTVCINPEILRRLGYQQNSGPNFGSFLINPQQDAQSYQYKGNFIWNNSFNDQVFDNALTNDINPSNLYSDSNYESLKQTVEDTNLFVNFDTKSFLDISSEVHQMINIMPDNSTSNLTNNPESNFDTFFQNISKEISSTSDLINDQFNLDNTSLNFELEKFKSDQFDEEVSPSM